MSARFTLESDFVDSYINSFIISNYYNENMGNVIDANIFGECINLNENVLRTANCTSIGDRVNHFISKLGEDFTKLKEVTSGSCASQALESHNVYYNIDKGNNEKNAFLKNYTSAIHYDKRLELKQCIDSKLI